MNTFKILSSHFKIYIKIKGLTGETYTYRSKNHPVVDYEIHKEICKNGSWLYIAVEGNSDVMNLNDSQKLYVGCKKERARMFRPLKGKNFHHKQMRKGNGQNNLEEYLQIGGTVDIYIISKDILEILAAEDTELQYMRAILVNSPKKHREHPAHWYEQIILYQEKSSWSWNTQGAGGKEIKHINQYSQNILV